MSTLSTITIEPGAIYFLSLSTPVNATGWIGRFTLSETESPTAVPYSVVYSTPVVITATPLTTFSWVMDEITTSRIQFSSGYYQADVISPDSTPIVVRLQKGHAEIDRI